MCTDGPQGSQARAEVEDAAALIEALHGRVRWLRRTDGHTGGPRRPRGGGAHAGARRHGARRPEGDLPACPPAQKTEAPPEAPPPAPVVQKEAQHNIVFAPTEVAISTGAGVTDYFGNTLNARTSAGATWDARMTFGAHSIIALEAGYVGSTNAVGPTALSGNSALINSNGIDGDFRLQLPFKVQPYIFGGVGWNHMSLNNSAGSVEMAASFNNSNDQLTIPAGGGLAGYIGKHAMVDVRGTYRLIPDSNFQVGNANAAVNQWMASARIGYAF